jgi:D-inositol-3-phosphate glycosyltransferase
LDRLIEAVADLKTGHPDIELMIAGGDGPDADNTRVLQNLADQRHLEHKIHFTGRVDHEALPCYYAAADLMVLPSQYESFGLVVLEALACGLPVASTSVGAAREVVRWKQNGILFSNPNTTDIAIGLERLLEWVNSRTVSRQQIRTGVRNFGWDRICGLVVRAYDLILDDFAIEADTDVSLISSNS